MSDLSIKKTTTTQETRPKTNTAKPTKTATNNSPAPKPSGKGTSVEQTRIKNAKNLAQKFKTCAQKIGAINTPEFQELLNQINKDNVIDVIRAYSEISSDESIMEMICDEKSNSGADRKAAVLNIFNKLVAKAKEAGVDVTHFQKTFNEDLDYQFKKWGATNTEKLDDITQAVIQATENKQQLSVDEQKQIANTPATTLQTKANNSLARRINSAQKSFNNQLKEDGWAGDVADFVGKLYGSNNTADKVRADLKTAKTQHSELMAAKAKGSDAYEAKFQEIFGIKFDPQSIKVYEKKEKIYAEASANHGLEQYFKNQASYLLNRPGLSSEYMTMPGTVPVTVQTATEADVYKREVAKLAKFLGENGQEILTTSLKNAGLSNASLDKKFAHIQKMAKDIAGQLHQNTLNAGGGKEFDQVQHEYEYSYKAAFGVKNDIMKRVTDYNISQQAGAGAVKAGVVIGATVAAAFTGGASLTTVAGITAGTTVVTEVTDKFTSGEVIDTLKADGFVAAIKKGNENTNYTEIFKQAIVSGGMVLVGGGVAKGVQFVAKGLTTAQQAAAMFGSDVVTGMAAEKLMTGEITVGGTVFNVLLSGAGNIVAVKMAAKAAQGGKASQATHAVKTPEVTAEQKPIIVEQETASAKISELSTSLEAKYGIKINKFVADEVEISQYGHTRPIVDIEFTCNGKNYTCTYGTDNNLEALEALNNAMQNQGKGVRFSSKIPGASKINPAWDIIPGTAKPSDLALVDKGINILENTRRINGDAVTIQFEYDNKNFLLTANRRTPSGNNRYFYFEDLQKLLHRMSDGEAVEGVQIQAIHTTDLKGNYFTSDVNPFIPSKWGNAATMPARILDRTNITEVRTAKPEQLLSPRQADNIAGQGISFRQAPDQPVYNCTRIEWGKTVEETIALNKKNGINIELVKDADGNYFMGIKDIWTEGGYHRIDRNSAVMQYGKYPKTDQYVDQAWAAKNADADGNIMDCAVIANDKGAQILENSYITESGQKIDFATMEAGTPVRKDPNATVNAVAYDSPQRLTTLEGTITTDITMGDVDGNVYNNFKQLKKQITKGQLVPNEADPNSARFIELVKAGDDDAAIALLKQATSK